MAQASERAVLSAITASPGAARVLIVDDETHMVEFCSRALRAAGYEVFATSDIQTALNRLANDPFDLLLADIMMPGISGLELAARARAADPAIGIIIMTGHASMETLHESVQRGAADYLFKPFELDELRAAVDQALQKRQLQQETIRLRAVEQLLASSTALNGILEREELARVIVGRALEHARCDVGVLNLYTRMQSPSETLALPERWVLTPGGHEALLEAARSSGPLLIEQRGPLIANDTAIIDRAIAVALRTQGIVVATMLLGTSSGRPFATGTAEVIALLAHQAGTALRNANLYSELQEAYRSLSELDRLKGEFISIASHELRHPLSIVLGYASMVFKESNGSHREYAQRMIESANDIKKIVDDMVDLRNLDKKSSTLTFENCDLDILLRQAVTRLEPLSQEKQQSLQITIEQPLICRADREKLLLVYGNLLNNAIKFTPSRGTISVSAKRWARTQVVESARKAVVNSTFRYLSANPPVEWAVAAVCDTGVGIPRDEQERIFERFYQIADSLTREQGGTGLGLAIVRDLVTMHGGVIWLESQEGKGSCFYCALPLESVGESLHRSVDQIHGGRATPSLSPPLGKVQLSVVLTSSDHNTSGTDQNHSSLKPCLRVALSWHRPELPKGVSARLVTAVPPVAGSIPRSKTVS
ncbi:response regulator [Candidatus Gracilibacteria bacterium]|nr:response regulator [Candidatus Gracilibacteria bacterium]